MGKSIVRHFLGFEREVAGHLKRLVRREEGAGEAVVGVLGSTKRLAQHLTRKPATMDHKLAVAFTKKGAEVYNRRSYTEAEELFRKALSHDPKYGRAYTYLGNTLYKMGHTVEAMQAWVTAIRVDPGSHAAEAAQAKLDRMDLHQKQQFKAVIDELER